MAIVLDGPVLPADLTVYVREVPLPNTITLNEILPDRHIRSNKVSVGTLTKTGRTARFRAYDARPHVNKRDVATLTEVMLPPLSDALGMGELERLQIEFARTGGTNQDAFVTAIYDDATILTSNAQRRMEQARGDVLADGKFTLAGEGGLTLEADYLIPGGNLVTPAGALWTDHAASVPLTDLSVWVRAYRILNGYSPGGIVMPWDRLQDLQFNAQLRLGFANVQGTPTFLSRDQLNSVLSQFGLPPIVQINDSSVDVDGTPTRVLPNNKILMIPPDPGTNLGYTAWGITATALELMKVADMSFEDAPGIVGIVDKGDSIPFRQEVQVDAVGMPVLENPNALMIGTVA